MKRRKWREKQRENDGEEKFFKECLTSQTKEYAREKKYEYASELRRSFGFENVIE